MPAHTMTATKGSYRFIPAVFQYSGGVAAEPGYAIERVTFREPVPLTQGFDRIASILKNAGRPLQAFCACELRSPAQFTEAGFKSFNQLYFATLRAWDILVGDINPVARSNVCPEIAPPDEPCFHAFAYTVPSASQAMTFCVAGSGEVPEGRDNYRDHIVRLGDVSADGMRAKAEWVLGEMERRMGLLGFDWRATTAVQAYTVHDMHPFLADAVVRRGAASHGLTWHFCRPPIVGLDFEMDCRGVMLERIA